MPEVDLDVGIGARICAGLDGVREAVMSHRRESQQARRAMVPHTIRLFGQATIPTPTAPTAILLGGTDGACPRGHTRLVRRFSVGAPLWGTAAPGSAQVYITASPQIYQNNAGQAPITEIEDNAATLPAVASYSNRQLECLEGEYIVMVITGGTAGNVYVATARVQQYQQAAFREEFVV